MAKIYGVELKNIRKTVGMEGEGFTANIYLDGKKIGQCADYGDGGEINIYYDDRTVAPLLESRIRTYFDKYPEEKDFLETTDIFLYKVFSLKEMETMFKKYQKQGYPVMVHVDFPLSYHGPIPVNDTTFCVDEDTAEKCEAKWKDKYHGCIVTRYTSLDNFLIVA